MTPEMKCQEVHAELTDWMLNDGKVLSAGLADHIARCDACRRLVMEQEELAKNLRVVRESVGEVPASLDGAVLAAFRRHASELGRSSSMAAYEFRPAFVWRWSLVAAIVLIAVAAFFATRKPARVVTAPSVARPTVNLVAQAATESAPFSRPAKPGATPKHMHAARAAEPAVSPERAPTSVPEEFRSLMYCDELSCPGGMELIHVQLPSSSVARAAGWTHGNVINADVIVGPDGIARGIRLEE